MVTRNWYNQFKTNINMVVIPEGLRDVGGTIHTSGYCTDSSYAYSLLQGLLFQLSSVTFNHAATIQSRGICLGSGTNPATIDDYKLENPILSGLTTSVSRVNDEEHNSSFVITLTNKSSEDITVGEIGYVHSAHNAANSTSAAYVLYDRTVLETPITIPAGGVAQVTYTIRVNYPSL